MPDNAQKPKTYPETVSLAPADVQNPLLRKAFDLWNALRGNRSFPSRGDVTPRNMAEFLRNTVLVRVLEGGKEFQFRIVGDAMVEVQGASFQGLTTAEIESQLPGYGAMLKSVYRQICKSGEPLAFRGWFVHPNTHLAFFHESLIMPLGEDGAAVDHILVVGIYAFEADGLKI
jgi:hypothetical protein